LGKNASDYGGETTSSEKKVKTTIERLQEWRKTKSLGISLGAKPPCIEKGNSVKASGKLAEKGSAEVNDVCPVDT